MNFALPWVALSQDLMGLAKFFQYSVIAVWTLLGVGGVTLVSRALTRRSGTPGRTFIRVGLVVVLPFVPDIGLALFDDA